MTAGIGLATASSTGRVRDQMGAWWHEVATEHVPARVTALPRILIAGVWLWELVHSWPYVDELYSEAVPHAAIWWMVWIAATASLLVGYRARASAAACFLVSVVMVYRGREIYHVDYFAQLAFFYLIFIDSGQTWSVDRALQARRGLPKQSTVRHLPVLLLLLHLSLTYLDAAGSHWLLNESWRHGNAVTRSLAHPQWASALGAGLSEVGSLPLSMLTYATVATEATLWLFVFVYILDRRRSWALATALSGGIALHLAIWGVYDIGVFAPFMIAMYGLFLPRRTAPGPVLAGGFVRRLELVGTACVASVALLVSAPAIWLLGPAFASSNAAKAGIEALRVLGDSRPHNVFADDAISEVFAIVLRDREGKVLPLVLDEDGERVGDLRDIRVFMDWFRLGRAAGRAWLAQQDDWIDGAELVDRLGLRFDAGLGSGIVRPGDTVTVQFQAWRIGADGREVKLRGPERVCVATVGTAGRHQIDCSP